MRGNHKKDILVYELISTSKNCCCTCCFFIIDKNCYESGMLCHFLIFQINLVLHETSINMICILLLVKLSRSNEIRLKLFCIFNANLLCLFRNLNEPACDIISQVLINRLYYGVLHHSLLRLLLPHCVYS